MSNCSSKIPLTWDELYSQLKWPLILHVYGFASLFFILAFYTFFSILNLRSRISFRDRPFMATINGFLCLLGGSRAVSLFIDPYESSHTMPRAIGSILWDLGFPCVLSALCLIQLAFLQLTQLRLGPDLRRKSFLSIIITVHFSCILAADIGIAIAYHEQFTIGKYVVQGLFVIWGILLCVAFFYVDFRLSKIAKAVPNALLACNPLDMQLKGIMQLALLAPYNNLASSVAAALVPTLFAPKIRITDENEQTFSFGESAGSDVPLRPRWSDQHKSQSDYTLHTVLNHIALMSKAAATQDTASKKRQLLQVICVTNMTAVVCIILCICEIVRVFGILHPVLLAATQVKATCFIWSWFTFQTLCRCLELIMACTMAAVTKQPVVRPEQPFSAAMSMRPKPTLYM